MPADRVAESQVDRYDIECVIDRAERDIQECDQLVDSDEAQAEVDAGFANLEKCRPLMLAAPGLLEACQKVASYLNYPVGAEVADGCGSATATICGKILRAAIAKAVQR